MSALMNRLVDWLSEKSASPGSMPYASRNDLPRHVLEITTMSAGSPFCYCTDSQVSVEKTPNLETHHGFQTKLQVPLEENFDGHE